MYEETLRGCTKLRKVFITDQSDLARSECEGLRMRIVLVCHVEYGYVRNVVVFDRITREGVVDGARNTIRISDGYGVRV